MWFLLQTTTDSAGCVVNSEENLESLDGLLVHPLKKVGKPITPADAERKEGPDEGSLAVFSKLGRVQSHFQTLKRRDVRILRPSRAVYLFVSSKKIISLSLILKLKHGTVLKSCERQLQQPRGGQKARIGVTSDAIRVAGFVIPRTSDPEPFFCFSLSSIVLYRNVNWEQS